MVQLITRLRLNEHEFNHISERCVHPLWPCSLEVDSSSHFSALCHWAIPGKKQTGGVEDPQEFLGFLLYPWKFQIKQGFTPKTPQNCVIPLETFKAKTS